MINAIRQQEDFTAKTHYCVLDNRGLGETASPIYYIYILYINYQVFPKIIKKLLQFIEQSKQ